jgi:solute carrier family 35 protein F5
MIIFSIGGVVLVSLSTRVSPADVPVGALWALSGAILYAIYLVLIRRRAENEDKLNMPMFLG